MQDLETKYTPNPLQFSASKLYFQHQNQILQKIWFISPMTIDTHFKYSFQEVNSDYFIEWGEFEWLTVDHDVHEQWIIYKIWFRNPKFKWIENLSVDLKKNSLDNPSVLSLFGWFIGWCIVFAILFWFSMKSQFWQVLLWLNVIGACVLLWFYIRKVFRVIFKKIKTKKADFGGYKVSYANESEALMISTDVLKIFKKLSEDYWITKFCYTGNCIYLLQDIHDRDGKRIKSSSKLYSEQEKAGLQQKTMNFINQEEFLFPFIW